MPIKERNGNRILRRIKVILYWKEYAESKLKVRNKSKGEK